MAANFGSQRETEPETNEEVFTKRVRAGKRTYFFDVRDNSHDYFLTITESRKKIRSDGSMC